jgi:hypothetical protein
MGCAKAMDDKEAMPLQAADLLVGQTRMTMQLRLAEDPGPLRLIRQRNFVHVKVVDDVTIMSTISFHNFGLSTRRLLTIQRDRAHLA